MVHVFGSYTVVQTTSVGRETQVTLRLRLLNPGAQAVSVERLTLLSLHPVAAKDPPAPILLGAHSTQEITEEFTIPTPEYQLWQKGLRPSLHLEMRTDTGARLNQTVRLSRMRLREEK